ncbi:hypothetical protein DAPPUDRAFT_274318 [Daphnia pulex]|uniref:Uncharacterized protein n=1 Tax=Daphnia pulex TaxID=6669 RepID=E9I432_DAPPU|nr:hypothetical protein DAPPUDRAFT_274318 [Daphnia pulex]|eukprot:EFX61248.1 hypothetical protein DAPPUDRAFT_274318 [Daphnia pulex]
MDTSGQGSPSAVPRLMVPVVQELNNSIIRTLRSSAKGSTLVRGKVFISQRQHAFLQSQHEITGRFKPCDDILELYGITTQRFFNVINSCRIKAGTFQLKVFRGATTKYLGPDLEPRTTIARPRLFFLFEREDCIRQSSD